MSNTQSDHTLHRREMLIRRKHLLPDFVNWVLAINTQLYTLQCVTCSLSKTNDNATFSRNHPSTERHYGSATHSHQL